MLCRPADVSQELKHPGYSLELNYMLPTVDGPVSLIASALRAVLPLARPAGSPENGDVDLYT